MSLNLARLFADAAALWTRDRDLWLRIAGFFFLVPALAVQLFTVVPDVQGQTQEAASKLALAWIGDNAVWLGGLAVWQVYAYGVILIVAIDPARPVLATAMMRALRMLPGLALAYLGAMLLFGLGLTLFVVPGLYLLGRTLLTLPVMAIEPGRGPLGALIAAIQRSHGRGWMLFLVMFTPITVQYLLGGVVGATGEALGARLVGSPAHLVFGALGALVVSAGALAQALLQAAAYRAVGEVRQGI